MTKRERKAIDFHYRDILGVYKYYEANARKTGTSIPMDIVGQMKLMQKLMNDLGIEHEEI